jgi:tetrahydromethanopterin S-methyltransferase subunit G
VKPQFEDDIDIGDIDGASDIDMDADFLPALGAEKMDLTEEMKQRVEELRRKAEKCMEEYYQLSHEDTVSFICYSIGLMISIAFARLVT